MSFRIRGLDRAQFQPFFGASEAVLAANGIRRYWVNKPCAFPDRIALRDCEMGEPVLLLNYTHQTADTPFRASHAIYVGELSGETYDAIDTVPDVLRRRLLSLRSFDDSGMMIGADVVEGTDVERVIATLFADSAAAYLHIHYAKPGCYAAHVARAD